jgi:DNA-binding transcriptional ArsR family regulator
VSLRISFGIGYSDNIYFESEMYREVWAKQMQTSDDVMLDRMDAAATEAAEVLKALSNPGRLRILCTLVPGPLTVTEIELTVNASQSYVSGQLLKLRGDGLVKCERRGRAMVYELSDPRVRPLLETVYELFCPDVE